MSLYFKYLHILFKSQMQYRTSFWLLSFGQFFIPFSVFAGLYFLFERFGQIKGWTFFEVALCFAVIHMAFAISECFARGFDSFSSLVRNGNFDRLLVRPRGTIIQVMGSQFEFTRFGRLIQSVIVLAWALSNLSIEWSFVKVCVLILMIVSGVFIFTGIFMLAATLCFWTIQGLEVVNIFTDGGREMAQYPLNIYHKWVTKFFTFVIPFGCVNYLPLLYVLGRSEGQSIINMLAPVVGIVFILPCLLVWQFGVKHYRSTGS
ncbi:ABC transporter permease [Lederbergia wuyishanensis]|uniref:ABC-2 type transport system permease protein n=1 Tax=Lederbergia wuyishanensis TaxID=1347903 RepID=A0ABU0D3J8_9BACI|nr:ABC-2 family transporter protein [Lederbergia wuyishanensis]MCJ8007850.1 ABC-2 family transporter protein [Lederbergia wuyishanensis]MDQ0342982.1 ABC-2 type transport system permease protein [Lederbergia wuyishanensis]